MSVMKAAQKLKIPYVIHESNVLPGVATKLLAKKASKILVGFEEAKERLPKGAKVIVTGTPTKIKNLNLSKEEKDKKKNEIGFDSNIPLVLVFGGSQGAASINSALLDIVENRAKNSKKISITKENTMQTIDLSSEEKYQIMWAPGPKQYDNIKEKLDKNQINVDNIDGVKIVPYIYNMEEMLNICDLVVARSGAMTITEIENAGKGAIFIPFPFAAENHQEYNARALEKAGCARVILDSNLTPETLDSQISNLVSNPDELEKMGTISHSLAINNVEDRIYTEIKLVIISKN